jgi:hypothetical protein
VAGEGDGEMQSNGQTSTQFLMPIVRLIILGLVLAAAFGGTSSARRCAPCALLTDGDCLPDGGILIFNSTPPNVPAYWTLFARHTRPGRLVGRLRVWGDSQLAMPAVPGFPAVRCEDVVCRGRNGRFVGDVVGMRLTAVARYPRGGSCEFSAEIAFGLGTAKPNTFVCRDQSGAILSEGALQVQGIRLRGCQQ